MARTERRIIREGQSIALFMMVGLFIFTIFRYQLLTQDQLHFQHFLGQITFRDGAQLSKQEAMGFYFLPDDTSEDLDTIIYFSPHKYFDQYMHKPEQWESVLTQFTQGEKMSNVQRFPGREAGLGCVPSFAQEWLDACLGQWSGADERSTRQSFLGLRGLPVGNYWGGVHLGCTEERLEEGVGTCYYQREGGQ